MESSGLEQRCVGTVGSLATRRAGVASKVGRRAGLYVRSVTGMDTAWLEKFLTSPGNRDFLPLFANKPPHFAQGSGSRYCNAGYNLQGL
jgi:hypothetical protein